MISRRIDRHHSSRGYSLIEILVVVGIIGILSLITVPAFINYQRRNAVRSALRSFTSDLRSFRQFAISKNAYVRLEFENAREYRVYQSTNFGSTWTDMQLGAIGADRNVRYLPETMAFTANTYNDSDSDGKPDVDFRPDGTAGDYAGSSVTAGTITMQTDWQDIINQVVVDMSTTGQIKTTEKKS